MALRLSDAYADFDAEQRFQTPGVRVADPKACQCGEVLKGVIKPWECKVFGTACTPEHAIGTCMVSPEGACAAYYNFGRYARAAGGGVSDRTDARAASPPPAARSGCCEIIETARAKQRAVPRRADHARPRRRRQGDPDADRGAAGARASRPTGETLAALADAGTVAVDGARLAMTTDSFVVKPLRFPGGSIGELAVNGTVNDLAMAGAGRSR